MKSLLLLFTNTYFIVVNFLKVSQFVVISVLGIQIFWLGPGAVHYLHNPYLELLKPPAKSKLSIF